MEEVIVTGNLESLRDALDVKRASLGVVEAASNYVGVLPDRAQRFLRSPLPVGRDVQVLSHDAAPRQLIPL